MFNRWGLASGMALALVGLVAEPAAAQDRQQGGRGLGFRGRGSLTALASSDAVQKELGIGDDAKAKIAELAEKSGSEAREQMQAIFPNGFQNLSPEERQQASEKIAEATRGLNAKYAPQLKEILKPDQFTRLQQIAWQAAGAQALADPELVKQLGLAQDQQEKIAAINRDFLKKQGELMANSFGGGGNFQEFMTKFRELSQQRDKLAEEVLTKDQQARLAELKGKPFDLSQLQPRGPRQGNN